MNYKKFYLILQPFKHCIIISFDNNEKISTPNHYRFMPRHNYDASVSCFYWSNSLWVRHWITVFWTSSKTDWRTALAAHFALIFIYFVVPYIAAIVLVFTLEPYRKIVGVGLIILGLYTLPITFYASNPFAGLIIFALLLSAGILAIRFKPEVTESTNEQKH